MKYDPLKYGAVLQAVRERAGFSQEEMANRLNRSQSCISKFEKNNKIPDMHTFMQWIEATNSPEVAVAFMFGMDGISIIQDIIPHILPTITGGFISWLWMF